MDNKQQNINDTALAYMERKYGEKFEYSAPWGDSMTGTHELLVLCDSLPEQNILVQIENYKKDDRIFRDNFIAVKYKQKTIDFLNECIAKEFGKSKLFYEINQNGLSPDLSESVTFDEYLADDRVPLIIMIEVKASDFDNDAQIENVIESISLKAVRFILTFIVSDDAEFPSSDRNEIMSRAASQNLIRGASVKKLDDGIQIEWLGGR